MSNEERRYEEITREWYQDIHRARGYHFAQFGKRNLKNAPAMIIARREVRLVARALAGLSPVSESILDVPCGTGKLVELFVQLGVSAVGMDISREMLDVLKQNINVSSTSRKLLCADATRLPFPNRAFDTVVCLRLLHRVPHAIRLAMLEEFARVARRHVIVSVGVNDGVQQLRLYVRNWFARISTVPFPIALKEFERALVDVGLTPLRCWSVFPVLSSEIVLLAAQTD